MVSVSAAFNDGQPFSASTPRKIRAALTGEEVHLRMLKNADRLNAGEAIATVPWDQVKARLGS